MYQGTLMSLALCIASEVFCSSKIDVYVDVYVSIWKSSELVFNQYWPKVMQLIQLWIIMNEDLSALNITGKLHQSCKRKVTEGSGQNFAPYKWHQKMSKNIYCYSAYSYYSTLLNHKKIFRGPEFPNSSSKMVHTMFRENTPTWVSTLQNTKKFALCICHTECHICLLRENG